MNSSRILIEIQYLRIVFLMSKVGHGPNKRNLHKLDSATLKMTNVIISI